MGYLFVFIAILSAAIKGFCGKKTGGLVRVVSDAAAVNIFRMGICLLVGVAIFFLQESPAELLLSPKSLFITLLAGVATGVFLSSWLIAVRDGAYMLVEVFLMLGVTFTVGASFVFLHEPVRPLQIAGMAVLIGGIAFMALYQKQSKGKVSPATWGLFLLTGFSNGVIDFSQKLYVKTVGEAHLPTFQLYTYLFAALTLILLYGGMRQVEKRKDKKAGLEPQPHTPFLKQNKKVLVYMLIMAVCLYITSYFKGLAAALLPAAILYPMMQGLSLFSGVVMSACFFGEKLSKSSLIGVLLTFLALLLIQH